jgi:hypothetical protein
MRVLQVVRDESMMVPGYEDQTLECMGCGEIEHRRVFRSEATLAPAEVREVADAPVDQASAESVPTTPPEPVDQSDDGEEMLRRAIAMVRSSGSPLRGLSDGMPATPAELAGATRTRKTSRVVQIRHDPSYEAAYAAKDTRSGLVVLRHQDRAHLCAMCDRLGWQVVEDGAPGAKD